LEEKKSIPSSSELKRHFGEKLKKRARAHPKRLERTKSSSANQKGSSTFQKGLEHLRALEHSEVGRTCFGKILIQLQLEFGVVGCTK
jgi:hypothetical protein